MRKSARKQPKNSAPVRESQGAAAPGGVRDNADQGYGGVWLGVHPIEDRVRGLQKLFGLPETVIPLSLIALGKPAEAKEPKNVFLPDRVRCDREA